MKNLNRIHLNALKAVESVLRLGSLAAAAEELGVTVGAVSQHVIRCEKQMGRKVFDRSARGLAPTAFGRQIAGRLNEGFARLDEAVALAQRESDDVLTISVAPVFAAKWLVPRLAGYSRLHPRMRVRLDASVALVDPDASDIDMAIRVGEGDWPGVKAEHLLPQEVFPVCTPALAQHLKTPEDLRHVPIVRDANANISWDIWLKLHGLTEEALGGGYTFTDAALALDAAIAGQGVLLAWQTLAHDALAAGLLVCPFKERQPTGLAYWLITSKERTERKKVKDFKDWLRDEISRTVQT
ncbi:LysR substrate-binding domain-containing protein [Nitratireductor luteus]|uniref:LysR substrate-binding domain-containing protein n=1 Tax=Nitratireductor luteus TaxID=2976980 RepID=UPI00223E911F|nr:LysR substrate-binding domain-containing protein [Nitratireductor luteus]